MRQVVFAMGPRRCKGYEGGGVVESCTLSTYAPGGKAQGKFDGCCVWCSTTELERRCADEHLRKLLVPMLKYYRQEHPPAWDAAISRLPPTLRAELVDAAGGEMAAPSTPVQAAMPSLPDVLTDQCVFLTFRPEPNDRSDPIPRTRQRSRTATDGASEAMRRSADKQFSILTEADW